MQYDNSSPRVWMSAPEGGGGCGNIALQKAAWKGDVNMLQLLLDLGADINRLDEDGWTPLAASTWACGDGPAARMLIAARADAEMVDRLR